MLDVLDRIDIPWKGETKSIEIAHGDLTRLPPGGPEDVLVVSTFRDDYAPTETSLVGALHGIGISAAELARSKEQDLLDLYGCWLSEPISAPAQPAGFSRILCFERPESKEPPEVVGDVFQALVATSEGVAMETVNMPLLATGDQGVTILEMLEPLLEAAVQWMRLGVRVKRLRIVERDPLRASEIKGAFGVLKKRYEGGASRPRPYDVFLSYSHKDKEEVDFLAERIVETHPGLRIFLDRLELEPGAAWQQRVFDALEDCRIVVPVYSRHYWESKVCREEFHVAWFRDRNEDRDLLRPVFLEDVVLPNFVQLRQYLDCRERNREKLGKVAAQLTQ